jgi:hypothetical protein
MTHTECSRRPERGRSRIDARHRCRWETVVQCGRDWTLWRSLAWRSSFRENRVSAFGVDCAKKLAAIGGRPDPCWRSLRERSRSRLTLVGLLGFLVLQCRLVFTCSSYEWYCWNHWLPSVKVKVTLRLTVSQPVCLGVEPTLGLVTRYCFESERCLNVTVLFLWGALSDERSGLSFVSMYIKYLHYMCLA